MVSVFLHFTGDQGFVPKTDSGYYGAGVYFSEYPGYSMGYISGASIIMLCQVLQGKVIILFSGYTSNRHTLMNSNHGLIGRD